MERWVGGRKEDRWKDACVAEGLDGGKVGGGRIARWKEGSNEGREKDGRKEGKKERRWLEGRTWKNGWLHGRVDAGKSGPGARRSS